MMALKHRNWHRALALLLVLLTILTGCGRRRTSEEKRASHRREGRNREESSETETWPAVTEPPAPSETQRPAPVPTERKEPLIYDDSVPDYIPVNPQWVTKKIQWNSPKDGSTYTWELPLNKEMYQYFKSVDRTWGVENFVKYVTESSNYQMIQDIVDSLREFLTAQGYSDVEAAREIAAFAQDVVEYEYDIDSTGMNEYPRYPIETLYEGRGDCEDSSILMAAMLKAWGYEVGLLHLPGHLAVAIRTSDTYDKGAYYEHNGHRYLYIESTGSGFHIGQIPKDELNAEAELFMIP